MWVWIAGWRFRLSGLAMLCSRFAAIMAFRLAVTFASLHSAASALTTLRRSCSQIKSSCGSSNRKRLGSGRTSSCSTALHNVKVSSFCARVIPHSGQPTLFSSMLSSSMLLTRQKSFFHSPPYRHTGTCPSMYEASSTVPESSFALASRAPSYRAA